MRTGKRENKLKFDIYGLMAVLIIGVVAGTLLLKFTGESYRTVLMRMTDAFIESRKSRSFIKTLSSSLFSTSIYLVIAFFVGYFAFGKPISIFVPFFKGLGLGISMADIFARYSTGGFKICLIIILPGVLIESLAIITASKESARASLRIFAFICGKSKTGEEDDDEEISFGTYIIKFAALFLIALIGAVVTATVSYFFGSML